MATEINRPLIQIDDEIREMTDEEHAVYLELQASAPPALGQADE
jgi:hypothetical protein